MPKDHNHQYQHLSTCRFLSSEILWIEIFFRPILLLVVSGRKYAVTFCDYQQLCLAALCPDQWLQLTLQSAEKHSLSLEGGTNFFFSENLNLNLSNQKTISKQFAELQLHRGFVCFCLLLLADLDILQVSLALYSLLREVIIMMQFWMRGKLGWCSSQNPQTASPHPPAPKVLTSIFRTIWCCHFVIDIDFDTDDRG